MMMDKCLLIDLPGSQNLAGIFLKQPFVKHMLFI